MDNLTINRAQSPSFGAIYRPKVKMSPLKEAIINTISTKLNEVNPNDSLKRTFVKIAEDEKKGYDIFIRENRAKDGIRVDLGDARVKPSEQEFDGLSFIGNYRRPEQFRTSDLTKSLNKNRKADAEIKKQTWSMAAMAALAAMWIGTVSYIGIKNDIGCTRQVDSKPVPAYVAKDTIKMDSAMMMREPVIKDVVKAGKKIIK